MNTKKLSIPILFFLFLSVQATAWAAAVPTVTQAVALKPGWNAVYLEVQPLSNAPAEVFQSLPYGSSVWAWPGKHDSVQFIQEPSEAPVNSPKWLAIFASSTESYLNNLYAITANSAFLIHVPAGNPPLTVNIEGRPTIRHKGWVPDSFNLIGFGFASTPPTYAAFFAPSKSHKNQAIYRLNNVSGAWEIVDNPAATTMRSGEAFWIYCQSGSDYQGPMWVEAGNAESLDFGAGLTLLQLKIVNSSFEDRSVVVNQLTSSNPVALAYRQYTAINGQILTNPLSGMPPVFVKAGSSTDITIAVQRGSFTGQGASVLEFTDAQGSRVRMPVTATSTPVSGKGLWTGGAALDKVSMVAEAGPAPDFVNGEAKPTPAQLNLSLILHQDRNGQVRLLKQMIMLYKDGTRYPDGTVQTYGRYVVLTDDRLIPNYSGVTLRDGAKFGRRMSAVGFDYSPSTDASFGTEFNNTAARCTGSITTSVTCQVILESSAGSSNATNPFLHRFHPDHDNLATNFTTFKQEANEIVRDITLVFNSTPITNPTNPPPGWGVSVLGGTYTEHIRGLAKGPIKVQGNFTLNLASDVDRLNE